MKDSKKNMKIEYEELKKAFYDTRAYNKHMIID
jgi:hypothetical protein